MTLRAVIVDDEPLAREGVALHLREEPDVEIVAMCADGDEAVTAIRELSPDLVFLDVRMPGRSGFDVIQEIGIERMPAVIFLTAYEQHALHAFRVNAIDYLLKPLDRGQIIEAMARARRNLAQRDLMKRTTELASLLGQLGKESSPQENASRSGRVLVRTGGNVHVINPDEIVWVEADGDYVTLHAGGKPHLLRESLRNMEVRLAPHGFQRIHRSILVSIRRVRELAANESGDYEAVLENGARLKVGRSYKDALFAALDTHA
jgi:two-component system, LytTR family, response regulator